MPHIGRLMGRIERRSAFGLLDDCLSLGFAFRATLRAGGSSVVVPRGESSSRLVLRSLLITLPVHVFSSSTRPSPPFGAGMS
jgi:hypothetical protein